MLQRDTKKTVAKVKAQTWAGIITGLIISALMAYGLSATSLEVAFVNAFGVIVLPILITVGIGYVRGYMKSDPEREALWGFAENILEAVEEQDPHAIEEYIRQLKLLKGETITGISREGIPIT